MIAPNHPETLAEFFEQRYKPEVLIKRTPSTVQHYERAVRLFLRFASEEVAIQSIDDDRIDAFEAWCRDARTSSKQAIWHAARIRRMVQTTHWSPAETWADAPEGSLRHYFETRYVDSRKLADPTIEVYRSTIQWLNRWHGEVVMLSDLCDDLVNGFSSAILDTNGERAAAAKTRVVMALWRSAIADGLVNVAPLRVRQVKAVKTAVRTWTMEQVVDLVKATESQTFSDHTTINGDQGPVMIHCGKLLKAWIFVGWDTALGRVDILRLKRSDIRGDGRIQLVQSRSKKSHVCRVRPETIAAIDETIEQPRERIFEFNSNWIDRRFRLLCSIAGLPYDRATTNKLRWSSGSHVEAIHPGAGPKHLGQARYGPCVEPTLPPPIPGYQAEPNGKTAATPPPLPGNRKAVSP